MSNVIVDIIIVFELVLPCFSRTKSRYIQLIVDRYVSRPVVALPALGSVDDSITNMWQHRRLTSPYQECIATTSIQITV